MAEGHFHPGAGTSVLNDIAAHAGLRMRLAVPGGASPDGWFYAEYESERRDIGFLVNSRNEARSVTLAYLDGYAGTSAVCWPGTGVIEERSGALTLTVPPYESVFVIREADNRREYRIVYTGRQDI